MGEIDDRLIIARQHLERAEDSHNSAVILLNSDQFADSVSRSYYAAYHASYGILYYMGFEPQFHKGVHNLFYIHLIKTELLDKKIIKFLSSLMEDRSVADYGSIPIMDKIDAEDAVSHARQVIDSIRNLLDRMVSTSKQNFT